MNYHDKLTDRERFRIHAKTKHEQLKAEAIDILIDAIHRQTCGGATVSFDHNLASNESPSAPEHGVDFVWNHFSIARVAIADLVSRAGSRACATIARHPRARFVQSRVEALSERFDRTRNRRLMEPFIAANKRGGNRRHVVVREVVNGLMYILSTGCQWRAIPKDLPPRSTLYDYFDLWGWDGTLDRIHDALYAQCRQAASREASPTAAIIDSQSVKSAEKGGLRSIRRATMQARRSRAGSGTSSSIRRAC